MAKDSPWFKFKVSEWSDGDISLEPYAVQGLFVSVCAYYWSRECDVKYEQLLKKFGQKLNKVDKFLEKNGECVSIKFLDEQWAERAKKAKSSSENGKSGGRPKTYSKPNQKPKQTQYREEGEKSKNKNTPLTPQGGLPWGERFAATWADWVEFRKQKRVSLTPKSVEMQLELLRSYDEDTAIEMIRSSITNGYTGIFPPKTGRGKLPEHL